MPAHSADDRAAHSDTARAYALSATRFECGEPRLEGATIHLPYSARAGDGTVAEFTETIELPASPDAAPASVVDGLLRLLSLAASLSYFKAFAQAEFAVPAGLSDVERVFIDTLIGNGLGEFAYINEAPEVLDTKAVAPPRTAAATAGLAAPSDAPVPGRVLVAVGGGKDSIVSIETLKSAGAEIGLFAIGSHPAQLGTARVAGLPLISARRRIDPELLRLNEAGAPNGHVPVTAINSLITILSALALDYDGVAFSNEAGSSYGNVFWAGRTINHQWSKSVEFERLLRRSLPEGAPAYFSLLRPINEIRIARRFASLPAYHGVFTSCNRAYRMVADENATWCADCPKCRFIFLMLAPFVGRGELLTIFRGRDMFADETQVEGFLELMGVDGMLKPFECVGEPDECRAALSMIREHDDWRGHPFLARPEFAALGASEAERGLVFAWRGGEHFVPPVFEAAVREI